MDITPEEYLLLHKEAVRLTNSPRETALAEYKKLKEYFIRYLMKSPENVRLFMGHICPHNFDPPMWTCSNGFSIYEHKAIFIEANKDFINERYAHMYISLDRENRERRKDD